MIYIPSATNRISITMTPRPPAPKSQFDCGGNIVYSAGMNGRWL